MYLENKNQKSNPAYQWTLANKAEIVWVCDQLLKSNLPSRKLQQIEAVREAANLRKDKLGHTTEGEKVRLEELYNLTRKLKEFE